MHDRRFARLLVVFLVVGFVMLSCRSIPIRSRFQSTQTAEQLSSPEIQTTVYESIFILDPDESVTGLLRSYIPMYEDNFADVPDDWDIHDYSTTFAQHEFTMQPGHLAWDVSATDHTLESFMPFIALQMPQGGFYLEMNLKIESDDQPYGAGLVFRYNDDENFYYTGVDKTGVVEVGGFVNGTWRYFTNRVRSKNFIRNDFNRLGILFYVDSYQIFINDKLVTWFQDESVKNGTWGFGTDIGKGDREVISIDNVRLMQPDNPNAPRRDDIAAATLGITPTITTTPTIFVVQTQAATFDPTVLPTRMSFNGSWSTLEGETNGLKYSIPYPDVFEPVEGAERPTVCLDAPERLCVVLQIHEGSWSSSEEFGDSAVEELNHTTKYFQLINSQKVDLTDGRSAYRVHYYNNVAGRRYETTRLFVAAGAVGVDLAVEGEIKVVEVYRDVIEQIVSGFSIQ